MFSPLRRLLTCLPSSCLAKPDLMSDYDDLLGRLRNFNEKTIPVFSFAGRVVTCRVVDVYDGDTCTVIFEHGAEMIKYKVRCMGYDCAEIKPKLNNPNREEEIRLAKLAKARFIELLGPDRLVLLKCLEFDKYGRILGYFYPLGSDVTSVDASLNVTMIREGHGRPYEGGTKDAW
jgi:endonuclease YncB( thermonuclease family)